MNTLPYFIAPLSEAMQIRTLIAHKARGFCFYINSLRESPAPRSTLDLRMVLGLTKVLPALRPLKQAKIPYDISYHLLRTAASHWMRPIGELDLRWIEIEFLQHDESDQYKIWDLIDRIINRGTNMPLSWRAEQMRTPTDTNTIPSDVLSKLEMSLASLESSLLAKDPMMPQHLRNTHSLLISYPETVHLLDDEEISRIIAAAQVHTKTEIVKATAKGTSASGSRKKVSIDDL